MTSTYESTVGKGNGSTAAAPTPAGVLPARTTATSRVHKAAVPVSTGVAAVGHERDATSDECERRTTATATPVASRTTTSPARSAAGP
jgi:hypothetical protein